jgi:hypothetical protein
MDSRSGTAVVVSDCRWRRGARNAASAALHAAIKTHRGEPGAVVMILVFKLSLPFIIDGRLFLIVILLLAGGFVSVEKLDPPLPTDMGCA